MIVVGNQENVLHAVKYGEILNLNDSLIMLKQKNQCYLLVFILCFLLFPNMSFASVGKAKMVLGKVMLLSSVGEKTRLRRGGEINVGDTVMTNSRGQAQLTMIDGTKISVRPGSKFQIEQFVATGAPEEQVTYYKLLKGGFRSVTGTIGKKNKASFRLSTPVATMGIRGTDFTGKYCDDDCPASAGKNGLFVDVISGSISMTNEGGTFNFDKDSNGYVSDSKMKPEVIDELPDNLLSPKRKKAKKEKGDRKGKRDKKRSKYPSPEEEMVQIGLYVDPANKDEIISEAMDAGVPPAQIMRGADSAGLEAKEFLPQLIKKGKEKGMDEGDFVAPILDSGINANRMVQRMMVENPRKASDILMAAIATGGFNNEQLKQAAISSGVSVREVESADTVGNLFALPPEVKALLEEGKSVDAGGEPLDDEPMPAIRAQELNPATESSDVASPS